MWTVNFSVDFKVRSQVSETPFNCLMIRPCFVSSLIFFELLQQLDYGRPTPKMPCFLMLVIIHENNSAHFIQTFHKSSTLLDDVHSRITKMQVFPPVVCSTWTFDDEIWCVTLLPPVSLTLQNVLWSLNKKILSFCLSDIMWERRDMAYEASWMPS